MSSFSTNEVSGHLDVGREGMRAGGGVGMEEGGIGPFNMAEAGKGAGERRREERGEPKERERRETREERGEED